jgi:hypothetical protein
LAGFEGGKDWRGPVADRLYLPAADGGRSITDAVIETDHIVNLGRALVGEEPESKKEGARFHFEYNGSVQGFTGDSDVVSIENIVGHSKKGNRCLQISFAGEGISTTPTFILPSELVMVNSGVGYELLASPTLYAGQEVSIGLSAKDDFSGKLIIRHYNNEDNLDTLDGPEIHLNAGEYREVKWIVPNTKNQPIADIGFFGTQGAIFLDYLTWSGSPNVTFGLPFGITKEHIWEYPQVWRKAFVNSMDEQGNWWSQDAFSLIQNEGRGMVTQGTMDWQDYIVEADIKPWLIKQAGIAARVQGLKRYYALMLTDNKKLIILKALDGDHVLAEVDFDWEKFTIYLLKLEVCGNTIKGYIDGKQMIEATDTAQPLDKGYVGYVVEVGHMDSQSMKVSPVS